MTEPENKQPDTGDVLNTAAKKKYKPDWIDSENKIFINKLNFICENFDKNHNDVSYFIL